MRAPLTIEKNTIMTMNGNNLTAACNAESPWKPCQKFMRDGMRKKYLGELEVQRYVVGRCLRPISRDSHDL